MSGTDPQADKKNGTLDHLPQELLGLLGERRQQVQAVARHDLDRQGRFTDSMLVLTDRQLGRFDSVNGQWQPTWLDLKDLTGAKIIEGLGVHMLRLLSDGKATGEFRCTLRHAKDLARLHRQLERQLEGKTDQVVDEKPKEDDKKVRCDKCGRVIPPWSEFCVACMSKRKVLSRLLDFVKPYRGRAIVGVVLALLVMLAGLGRPYLTKPILNDGLGLEGGKTADFGVLMYWVGVLAGLTILAALAEALRHRLMAKLSSRICKDVRDTAYGHLHKLSLSYFAKKPTGSLVTRITSDTDRIWDFVAFTVIESAISILTILGVVVVLMVMDWRLACIVLLPIPLMLVLTLVFHKKMHKHFDRIFHRWSQMTSVVSDALPGVRVIKAFSQEAREVDRFSQKSQAVYDSELAMITLWTMFGPMLHFASHIGALLVWIVGGYWAVTGELDPGTLMAFISYMWMFYGPIHMISHMDRMFNRAAVSVQRIFEILDTEPAIYSKRGAQAAGELAGEIELRDVSFSYDGIRRVLKNVSIKIHPGEMVGLAGPSGGGKTTMINLICRFYDVLEGQILIDGVDVRDYQIEDLRRKIGVVLQEPFLFHGTVAQNIAYGNPQATMEQIITAAHAANAHDFIVGFPDGYDTLVGERGQTLSGGERQRISIARAILNNPRILILDEATSSVDTQTEKLIQEALDRLIANRTTIAIAHRLSTLRKADRLVVLENGEVKEQGSHEELSGKEDGLYAKLLKMQTETQSIIAIG